MWLSLHLATLLYCMSNEKNPRDAGATTFTLLVIGFKTVEENFYRAFWLRVFHLFGDFPSSTPGSPDALLSFSFLLHSEVTGGTE